MLSSGYSLSLHLKESPMRYRQVFTIVLIIFLGGCKTNGDGTDNRFDDYVPPEDIYRSLPDSSSLVIDQYGYQFQVNETILRVSPETTKTKTKQWSKKWGVLSPARYHQQGFIK